MIRLKRTDANSRALARTILQMTGQHARLPLSDVAALRMVVLRHDLGDGSHHFDWLIATDPQCTEPLVSFRLNTPLDQLEPGRSLVIERMADHRSVYLEYEGPISDDRGLVKRIAAGSLAVLAKSDVTTGEGYMLDLHWR